nr:uncharacterized protein LOC125967456 [Syngnathus scovelli]XP_049574550.1 uncharacterized protein LOC125967456 [Syngnathus scovelli]
MGNGKSKNNIRDNLKCKDWKIIERQDPDRLKNLDKWVKKYKFEGQLKTTKLIELRGAMKERTKRDPRKMKKEGDEDVVFWLKVAAERERGEKERVEKALYCRKEDDETGANSRQARDNQNLQRAREEGGGVEEVEKHVGKAHATTSKHKVIEKLYPQIPDTGAQEGSPPPYGLTDRATRQKNPIEMDWSKEMGANYPLIPRTKPGPSAPVAEEATVENSELTPDMPLYPMIQVANPNYDPRNEQVHPRVVMVYRTWTMDDVRKALEGVVSYREDVEQFCTGMEDLRRSYNLNGTEVQQVWMTALGPEWHLVRGEWAPINARGQPLPYNSPELVNQMEGLINRVRNRYRMRANYTEIGRTKQNDNEAFDEYRVRMTKVFKTHSGLVEDIAPQGAYQQQLKNAIHAGSRPAIQGWVIKHYIGMNTGTLEEYINHALHAEKVVKEKQKQVKATKDIFLVDEDSDTFYQDTGRAWKGQRGRGATSRGGSKGHGRGFVPYSERECWNCGEKGHMAHNCPYKQNNND